MSKSCEETLLPVRPTLDVREDNTQLAAYDEKLAALHKKMLEKKAALPLQDFLRFLNADLLGVLRKAVALLRSKNTPETDLRLQLLNTHLKLYQDYHDELSKCQVDGPKNRQSSEIVAAVLTGEQAMFQAYLRDHANGLALEKIDKTNRTLAMVTLQAFIKLHPELSRKMPLEIVHKIMGNKDGNMVTIDDGPNEFTPQILAILAESGVCAIFYLLGENVNKYPEHARAIVNGGHIVGYHSMSNEKGEYYTPETLEGDFAQFQKALNKALGSTVNSPYPVALVRMPYGTSFSYKSYLQNAKDPRSTLHGTAYLPMGNGTPRDCNWDIHDGSFRGKGWIMKDASAKADHYRDHFKKDKNKVFLLHQDPDDVEALRTMLLSSTAEAEEERIAALFGKRLVEIARGNLGNPYDTSPEGMDGGALAEYMETGRCKVKSNFTGEIIETDKKPFVCTDLVIEALSKMGLKDKIPIQSPEPFDWRRITEIEKAMSQTDDFVVIDCNFSITFPSKTIPQNMDCRVGDIITIIDNKSGGRHVGIVTSVDSSGNPLTMIHSSGHRGVVETPFLNTSVQKDYKGQDRYDGFLYGNAKVKKIIRPSQNNMVLAMNI